jgi:cardiolipin synthase
MRGGFNPWLHLILPHAGTVVGFALAVVLIGRIGIDRRPVTSAWAWLLAVLLVPWIGVPLFLAFGGRKLRRSAREKNKLYQVGRQGGQATPIERVLAAAGAPPARDANHCELLADGQTTFARTLEMIETAQHTIDLATFILARDPTGDAVLDALERRARQHVKVRVLVDAFFAFRANHRGLGQLRAAGGHVAFFMPLVFRRPFRGHANLRNHRKLLVADGKVAIAGGMNLAEEYMGPTPLAGRWRDVAIALCGPAVDDIVHVFESDWAFATRQNEPRPPSGLAAESVRDTAVPSQGRVQVVASGPDTVSDTLYETLLTAIFEAQQRIAIATPYFVPDEPLMRALFLALHRGVQMTIVVPSRSNHRLADLAGASYLRDLQAAGARVRPFLPGMLHAKVLLVDDRLAIVGSANFDMRSLFLDFELLLLCTATKEIDAIGRWFEETLAACAESLNLGRRRHPLLEGVARLVAPLV